MAIDAGAGKVSEIWKVVLAYRYVAAIQTLELWMNMAENPAATGGQKLRCQSHGIVQHDRFLCGDAENTRRWR